MIGIGIRIGRSSGAGFWQSKLFTSGDGTTLDTSKWTVTNPTVTAAEFEQRNAVVMHSLEGTNANLYANNIKGSDSRAEGVWFFSLLDIQTVNAPLTPNANFVRAAGLANSDFTNSIEFYRSDSQKTTVGLRIRQSGSVVYNVSTTIKDLALIKLIINASHEISVYRWVNDAWVQIDSTQTFDLGAVSLFMATKGYDFGKTTLRDIYIATEDKYPTALPVSSVSGVDAREFGAVPDGSTDCTDAINDALVAGDVIIQNGEFLVTDAIEVPSGRTCYIKNARIVKPDASYSNVFRNFGTTKTGVKIIGLGNAVIFGNSANNHDNGSTHGDFDGGATVLNYVTVLLWQIENFEVRGLNIVDYPRWCMHLSSANNGIIDDIYLNYGVENHNQDGIDIYLNCHDIDISNVRSMTDDDALLIAGCNQQGIADYTSDGDLYNISITDWKVYYTPARAILLLGEGDADNQIHDISFLRHKSYNAEYGLLIGIAGFYTAEPAADDIKEITFDDCEVNTCSSNPIRVLQNCENIYLTDWVNNSGKADFYMPTPKEVNDFNINGTSYPTPVVVSAAISDINRDQIAITFNTKMDQTVTPATSVFAVDTKTVESVAWSTEKILIVTVTAEFAYGDTITFDYTKPISNPITNLYGEEVATFTDQSGTNNIIASFPDGAIGIWDLNGDVADSSGNGYDLTNNNGVLTTDHNGDSNKAYTLATNAYLIRSTFAEAKLDEFTACFRFKANSLSTNDIFLGHLLHTSYAQGWHVYYNATTGKMNFWVDGNNGGAKLDISFNDTTNWHFICVSYKKTAGSDNMKFSIDDGTPVTANLTKSIDYGSCDFQTGRSYTGYANFKIGFIALFNRELSAEEKTFMYNYED